MAVMNDKNTDTVIETVKCKYCELIFTRINTSPCIRCGCSFADVIELVSASRQKRIIPNNNLNTLKP